MNGCKQFWGVLAAMCFAAVPALGQYQNHFHKVFDPQTFSDMAAVKNTGDGGYIYTGTLDLPMTANNYQRPMLIKLSPSFQVVWAVSYVLNNEMGDPPTPTGLFISPRDVIQTHDGGYLMCGRHAQEDPITGLNLYGAFLLKTDAGGNVEWYRIYPTIQVFNSVIELGTPGTRLAGYLACGEEDDPSTSFNLNEAVVVKTDFLGGIVWHRAVWGVKTDFNGNSYRGHAGYNQIIRYDGNTAALVGTANLKIHSNGWSHVDADVLVSRIDLNGNFLLNKIFGEKTTTGGDGNLYGVAEYGAALDRTASGDLVITGGTGTTCLDDCEPSLFDDLLVLRVTAAGGFVWANRYDVDGGGDWGAKVLVHPVTPRVFVAGGAVTDALAFPPSQDMALLELNPAAGQVLSAEVFGDAQNEAAAALVRTGPANAYASIALLGDTTGFSVTSRATYLVEHFASIQQRCHDVAMPIRVNPMTPSIFNPVVTSRAAQALDQPLLAVGIPLAQNVVCSKIPTKGDPIPKDNAIAK